MNDTGDVLNDVIAEMHRLHGKRMVAAGDELYYGLERALKMLPQDNLEWAVAMPTLTVLTRSAGLSTTDRTQVSASELSPTRSITIVGETPSSIRDGVGPFSRTRTV